MVKEIVTSGDTENEKDKFYSCKSPINNILVPKKISSGDKSYKYFTEYLYDDYKIKPLHIILPKRVHI